MQPGSGRNTMQRRIADAKKVKGIVNKTQSSSRKSLFQINRSKSRQESSNSLQSEGRNESEAACNQHGSGREQPENLSTDPASPQSGVTRLKISPSTASVNQKNKLTKNTPGSTSQNEGKNKLTLPSPPIPLQKVTSFQIYEDLVNFVRHVSQEVENGVIKEEDVEKLFGQSLQELIAQAKNVIEQDVMNKNKKTMLNGNADQAPAKRVNEQNVKNEKRSVTAKDNVEQPPSTESKSSSGLSRSCTQMNSLAKSKEQPKSSNAGSAEQEKKLASKVIGSNSSTTRDKPITLKKVTSLQMYEEVLDLLCLIHQEIEKGEITEEAVENLFGRSLPELIDEAKKEIEQNVLIEKNSTTVTDKELQLSSSDINKPHLSYESDDQSSDHSKHGGSTILRFFELLVLSVEVAINKTLLSCHS
mmetsp:Transcript_12687/g.18519  ORF Transcript_12687/g.18519 Transcript_12687/m.18519 type:complete len:416 (-) Transcript_12687:137-1384(-)